MDGIPGHTRENFLMAIQHELRAVQDNFPGKLVQMGYFPVEDDQLGDLLWQWLYPYLAAEFNGIVRPRVSFFQEDLASNRPSAAPDFIPYTDPPSTTPYLLFPEITRIPSFAYYCDGDPMCFTPETYNNGIVFQANSIWSAPLTEFQKTTKTLNSMPNDALEGSFNSYFGQYLEVYKVDLEHADTDAADAPWDKQRWSDGLQSWKDYTDYLRNEVLQLEAPAGLTVLREAANHNTVSWFPVYSPTGSVSYTLQRRSYLNGSWTNWAPLPGACSPTATECVDTTNTAPGTPYGYRVQASNGINPTSAFAQIAVFVSEASYDGYVKSNLQVGSSNMQPGIRAGRFQGLELRGILSFNISALGNVTALAARLNLKQTTNNDGFVLGSCQVDSKKGSFGAVELEGTDFSELPSHSDVTQVPPLDLGSQTPPDWVSAELNPEGVSDISSSGSVTNRTQFRLSFPGTTNNKWVGWNSGEATGSESHLVVQFEE